MSKPQHNFHIIDPSPLPIMSSISLFILALGAVFFIHDMTIGKVMLPAGFVMILSCMYSWWRDVIKEGREDKAHTNIVRKGLSVGMVLFILSELMFFFAFFFSFFHASVFPAHILSDIWPVSEGVWPPANIKTLDAFDIPLLNTLILLLSGTTVTWAHHALVHNNHKEVIQGLACTVFLGICFSIFQAYEYHHAEFGFKDGVYAANFYMATGFHGLHVLIGTIFLAVCLVRAMKGHFAHGEGFLGFEFAAWYWHFVDVVWLFLFAFVYIWGS